MLIELKVPYSRQEKWFTCGPACLRMIFAYLGIDVTEKALETACETTELGTTPTQISTGAAKFGVDAIATKNADFDDLKRNLEFSRCEIRKFLGPVFTRAQYPFSDDS